MKAKTHGKENKETKRAGKGKLIKSRGQNTDVQRTTEKHTKYARTSIWSSCRSSKLLSAEDKNNETTQMSEKGFSTLH